MRINSEFPVKYEKEVKESTLSSFGGTPVFLKFLKTIGFDQMVWDHFKPKSNQGFHPFHNILTLTLLNILNGESISDVKMLEEDSGLVRVLKKCKNTFLGFADRIFPKNRSGFFPSETTLFTFLNGFKSDQEEAERDSTKKGKSKILPVDKKMENLTAINREIVAVAQTLKPVATATLDMDNNIIVSNKRNAKVSYKKEKSYQPFNVYWHEQNLMIYNEFRDGNVPPGYEQSRLLKESIQQLPASVKKIQVRSDSAGYQHEFLEYMESHKGYRGRIEFAVSCDVSKSFRSAVLATPESEWEKVYSLDKEGNKIETNQEVAEIFFVPETKNKKKNAPVFRYLATREATDIQMEFSDNGQLTFMVSETVEKKLHLEVFNEVAYKIFGVVTNKTESALDILLWHRKRCGKAEQEHSRLTKDMAGGRFPSGDFGPNAAWWQMAIISLNLLKLFQQWILPCSLKNSRIKKLNRYFFQIAVNVIKRSSGLVVRVGKESSLYFLIQFAQRRLLKIERALEKANLWRKNEAIVH
ncbi:MAG: IS1380 family transposase [Desulfobacteraceae bacterium]|nr:IS1380 family transposase [Desulfobacteraceae bacterium]